MGIGLVVHDRPLHNSLHCLVQKQLLIATRYSGGHRIECPWRTLANYPWKAFRRRGCGGDYQRPEAAERYPSCPLDRNKLNRDKIGALNYYYDGYKMRLILIWYPAIPTTPHQLQCLLIGSSFSGPTLFANKLGDEFRNFDCQQTLIIQANRNFKDIGPKQTDDNSRSPWKRARLVGNFALTLINIWGSGWLPWSVSQHWRPLFRELRALPLLVVGRR